MKRLRHTELLRLVLLSAVLVLGLALPRALVWCHNRDHGLRLEFAHAPGTCCNHDHEARPTPMRCTCGFVHADRDADSDRDTGSGVAGDDHGCQHASVCIDLLPAPPTKTPAAPPPTTLLGCLPPPGFAQVPPRSPANPPPATGPPRPDPRLALRATTLLLL